MFRNTLKTLSRAFSSKPSAQKALGGVNFFEDMKKDPHLAKEMKIMQDKFAEVRANPEKYKLKEIEIDPKEIEETEQTIRDSRKHSIY